jgi:hypothetical protein
MFPKLTPRWRVTAAIGVEVGCGVGVGGMDVSVGGTGVGVAGLWVGVVETQEAKKNRAAMNEKIRYMNQIIV